MISMPKVNSIREMRRDGLSIAEIARNCGVSRDTVYKYIQMDDFSPQVPVAKSNGSKIDPYAPLIEQWLDEDARNWRKQRHTAKRIWERLRDECGADVGYSTVRRYVSKARRARSAESGAFLDLVWAPGEAQADFGEADFTVYGMKTRLKYLVLSFPFSNVGLAQVFPGENAECVCEGLKRVFEYMGGVPTRIVFDNATGVGRKMKGAISTTRLFGAFAAHYGFSYSFCNPESGHEKGNVENKVGYLRRELFVPMPIIYNVESYNARLLDECMGLSGKEHWRKGEPESQLFVEDRLALAGLPANRFNVVRYERRKANGQGKVQVGGRHMYSSAPELAGCELIIGISAFGIDIYDEGGTLVSSHARAYGKAPTDTASPASQLPLLCYRPSAWKNSQVRASLPDDLRRWLDSLDEVDLRGELRLMRDESARLGWRAMVDAAKLAFDATGRVDAASMAVGAARMASSDAVIDYDEPVDLTEYDIALGMGR